MKQWDVVIVHIKGSDNKLPDCLSRIYMLSEVSRRPEDYLYLISLAHDLAGHFSVKQTLKNLESFISWPNMLQDIQEYVKKCEACIRNKPFNKNPPFIMKTLVYSPFEHIYIDTIGKLSGFPVPYVLVIIDRFSRLLELVPL